MNKRIDLFSLEQVLDFCSDNGAFALLSAELFGLDGNLGSLGSFDD